MKLTFKLLIGAAVLLSGAISGKANIDTTHPLEARTGCCIPPLCPPCDFTPTSPFTK